MIAVIETAFGTAAMTLARGPQTFATGGTPTRRRAIGVTAIA
ncbi:MAG TPA: hypothetical protein VIX63_13675 [Vicinamibacterales bacterium]